MGLVINGLNTAAVASGVKHLGEPATNTFYQTGNGADGDVLSITFGATTRNYELDTDSAVTGDNVLVDISGGATNILCIAALVSAINADASRVCNAVALPGNGATTSTMILVALEATPTATTLDLAKTNYANGVIPDATGLTGAIPAVKTFMMGTYTLSANDATLLNRNGAANGVGLAVGAVASTSMPVGTNVSHRVSQGSKVDFLKAGAPPSVGGGFLWVQANSAYWVLYVNNVTTSTSTFATDDLITWTAFV